MTFRQEPGDLYYWGGRRRLENPILRRKRVISSFDGEKPVYCPWDIRRWILPGNDSYMVEVWQEIAAAHRRDFETSHARQADLSAKAIWHFVVEKIRYINDDKGFDFWQFPQETINLEQGDCEDKSFLVASLLLAAGIPEDRVRVTVGAMHNEKNGQQKAIGHAWPMYRTNRGVWCILETCMKHLPVRGQSGELEAGAPEDVGIENSVFLNADRLARDGRRMQYVPLLCFDNSAVWTVEETWPGLVNAAAELHPEDWSGHDFGSLWTREMDLDSGIPEVDGLFEDAGVDEPADDGTT